jgi:hypothetical protein
MRIRNLVIVASESYMYYHSISQMCFVSRIY